MMEKEKYSEILKNGSTKEKELHLEKIMSAQYAFDSRN